jgi:hypothetical protein
VAGPPISAICPWSRTITRLLSRIVFSLQITKIILPLMDPIHLRIELLISVTKTALPLHFFSFYLIFFCLFIVTLFFKLNHLLDNHCVHQLSYGGHDSPPYCRQNLAQCFNTNLSKKHGVLDTSVSLYFYEKFKCQYKPTANF